MRPRSIQQFTWIYLASIVIGLAMAFYALFYVQTVVQESGGRALDATAGTAAVVLIMIFGLMVPLALWTAVAFFGSRIAKWILVVFSVLSIVRVSFDMPDPFTLFGMMAIVSTVLTILAIILLFMPDAQEWFAEQRR